MNHCENRQYKFGAAVEMVIDAALSRQRMGDRDSPAPQIKRVGFIKLIKGTKFRRTYMFVRLNGFCCD